MANNLVDYPLISKASLHKKLPLFQHLYVWPFLFAFPFLLAFLYKSEQDSSNSLLLELRPFFICMFFALQIFIWLTGNWNARIQTILAHSKCSSIDQSDSIYIVPGLHQGCSEICPIIKSNNMIYFYFQKRKFIYSTEKQMFTLIPLPIDKKPTIEYLQNSQGFQSIKDLDNARLLYDENKFDIPVPSFTDLFKQHAVAPFFVFQIFSILLWCLDEYIYYSLFTLLMVISFECTVVWQRQKTLQEFRSMSIKPYDVHAFRQNKWIELSTEDLLPGDLIAIGRPNNDQSIPCDLLLLQGSCVVNEAMLSGESTPVVKESIAFRDSGRPVDLDGVDKSSVLFSGTKILQANFTEQDFALRSNTSILHPPPGKIIALVIKTAFETSQGSLVRVMVCSHEQVSANNFEALLFILLLLVFAIAAASYVWKRGTREGRNRWKLLLDCILIITSVVPPELPMELTLAANASMAALTKFHIFCTEAFRIPFAGKVDVCCFDKTGTLTQDKLIAKGVAVRKENQWILQDLIDAKEDLLLCMATAHTLVKLESEKGEIVGDPMEKATIESIGWSIEKDSKIIAPPNSDYANAKINIVKHFPFSSALKRQASLSTVSVGKSQNIFVAVKGAPETVRDMLVDVPSDYEKTYKHYGRKGFRVIALAYRYINQPKLSISELKHLDRDTVESSLIFCGFQIFSSPLKEDAASTICALNNSSHRCLMITGDNALTACHVAKTIGLLQYPVLILENESKSNEKACNLIWRDVEETIEYPVTLDDPLPSHLVQSYEFCITGSAFSVLSNHSESFKHVTQHTWVWARLSPMQKELLVTTLKQEGLVTLMCGDGTNDVGALKQANVGVAMLNGTVEDIEKITQFNQIKGLQALYEKQLEVAKRFNIRTPPVPKQISHLYPAGANNPHKDEKAGSIIESTKVENTAQDMTSMMMNFSESLNEEAPQIKLGDASVAAPFTSKLASCDAICKIIRQGRCTLVATIQMYKILALNCLISAYTLSVLYLDGIKFDDSQALISGVLISICFLCISKGKPIETLSKQRPQSNIFNRYIVGSILAQFAIHIIALRYTALLVQSIEHVELDGPADLEKKFEPSLMNSAMFLLQLSQQVSTFAVNYIGRPFREGLTENKGMYWGLIGCLFVAFSGSTEFYPEMNQKLKFVPFTSEFKWKFTLTMIFDLLGCYLIEYVFKLLFSNDKPKEIVFDKVKKERKLSVIEE